MERTSVSADKHYKKLS